jgi:hypothetical protein
MRFTRRTVAVGALATALVGGIAIAAPAAQASTVPCGDGYYESPGSATVSMPSRVSISHAYETITVRANGQPSMTCYYGTGVTESVSGTIENVVTRSALDYVYIEELPGSDSIQIYSWEGPGRFHFVADSYATPATGNTVDVRYAGYSKVSAVRHGSKVTLTVKSTHYGTYGGQVGQRVTATVQKYVGGRWVSVGRAATGSGGVGKVTVTNKHAASYRVVSPATAVAWSSTSAAVRK